MDPSILILPAKRLVGMKIETSVSNYMAPALWQKFMPRVKEIKNGIGTQKYSIQIYSELFDYSNFNPNRSFTYWAATEVSSFDSIPDGMEALELMEGKYALFIHKGTMESFPKTLGYIYEEWLPTSGFSVDHRPHFELLDERYLGPNHPDSEEEVWVPIK
ncbi:MAG: GyrI-like domain-containing protein [Balneola sp.]